MLLARINLARPCWSPTMWLGVEPISCSAHKAVRVMVYTNPAKGPMQGVQFPTGAGPLFSPFCVSVSCASPSTVALSAVLLGFASGRAGEEFPGAPGRHVVPVAALPATGAGKKKKNDRSGGPRAFLFVRRAVSCSRSTPTRPRSPRLTALFGLL